MCRHCGIGLSEHLRKWPACCTSLMVYNDVKSLWQSLKTNQIPENNPCFPMMVMKSDGDSDDDSIVGEDGNLIKAKQFLISPVS